MKTVTMDFKTYSDELAAEELRGIRRGAAEARRIILEILAGASIENLGIDDDFFHKFAQDIEPRLHMIYSRLKK